MLWNRFRFPRNFAVLWNPTPNDNVDGLLWAALEPASTRLRDSCFLPTAYCLLPTAYCLLPTLTRQCLDEMIESQRQRPAMVVESNRKENTEHEENSQRRSVAEVR